jgi:EAL domain-containing protein (putative c-di-GMP-specific phosphodiesterase class I)/GGDEF domain-containing protein
VPGFLGALARQLHARMASFVAIGAGSRPVTATRSAQLSDGEHAAVDAAGRQWLAGAHRSPVRVRLSPDLIADVAAVRGPQGETLGAVLLVRPAAEAPPAASSAAELELAATLLAAVLDRPDPADIRQSVLDWASTRAGGRTAFAVTIDDVVVLNDVLGYPAGDVILRALLERLELWAGPYGRVACIGDARYLAIRTDIVDSASARREAEQLRQALAAPVDVAELSEDLVTKWVSRSASIGIAVDARGEVNTETVVVGAVRSVALARAAGGDRVEVYDEHAAADQLARLRLNLELSGAVLGHQLRMHYQPEFDLGTGRIIAVEGLLRWQHPRLGLLGAESFVPSSEQSHTFSAVQRWVIEECCRQLALWRAAGLAEGMVLRINVAAAQVLRGAVSDVLPRALQRESLPGECVCVELTERRMPADTSGLANVLTDWRASGVSVAIDDFGTGDATLSHVLDLPVDVLKIDQRFVARMLTNHRAHSVVASVIALAAELGLDVVAEGVDGSETADQLLALGCRRGQGNALGPAQEPERIARLLQDQPQAP